MGEDASLDEFLSDDGGSDAESESAVDEATEESVAGATDEAAGSDTESDGSVTAKVGGSASAKTDQQPATTTYAWDGDGAACAECGEVVERRWEQAGALVCVACKAW